MAEPQSPAPQGVLDGEPDTPEGPSKIRDLYLFGKGAKGRLGHGDEQDQLTPQLLDALIGKRPRSVSCGSMYTAIVTADGQMYTWGQMASQSPVQVAPRLLASVQTRDIRQVSCGGSHLAFLTDNSTVYTMGVGTLGQLGTGEMVDYVSSPCKVEALQGKGVRTVQCGDEFTMALTDTKEVYSWGRGDECQLGHGDWLNQPSPRIISSLVGKQIRAIASGDRHAACITDSGELYTWGAGKNGRLGHGDETDCAVPTLVRSLMGERVRSVHCGGCHTAAITESGQLFLWGWNHFGQLGHGDTTTSHVPRQVTALQDLDIAEVSCGQYHTAVLTSDGRVFTWGCGNHGCLGHGDWLRQLAPKEVMGLRGKNVTSIACGAQHTAAITKHVWIPDEDVLNCILCNEAFSFFRRRHHCRHCGRIFCGYCASNVISIPRFGFTKPVRVCDICYNMLSGRHSAT